MKTRPAFGKFLARAEAGQGELYLYSQIGGGLWSEGVTAKQVVDALAELEKTGTKSLAIYINSPGGDVFEGMAILNCLKRFEGQKTVYVDGIAASIASIIAMAGDKICMGAGSMMMLHDPSAVGMGTAPELREKAAMLDKAAEAMVEAYALRTGCDEKEIRGFMAAETWFTASEAVEHGFADEKTEQDDAPDAMLAISKSPLFAMYRNAPAHIRASAARKPPVAEAAPQDATKENEMKTLLVMLGLSASATEDQAITAAQSLITYRAEILKLTGKANDAEAVGTLLAWKSGAEQAAAAAKELAEMKAKAIEAEVVGSVDAAIRDGKAAPAQRDSLLAMGRSSPDTLRAFVAAAPKVHAQRTEPGEAAATVTLTAQETEVAEKMGQDPKLVLAAKTKAIAEGRAPFAQ